MTAPIKINVHLWGTDIGQLTWDEYGHVATFQFSEDYSVPSSELEALCRRC